MKITRVPIVATALLLCGILAPARLATACSCIHSDDLPSNFRILAPTIFLAQVLSVHGPYTVIEPHAVAFVENRRWFMMRRIVSWEGEVADTVFVETNSMSASCGYAFRLGGLYLVYASAGRDTVRTGICTRTRLWMSAYEDSVGLGAPSLDRSTGQPWSAFAPPSTCPVHKDTPLRRDHSIVVYGMPERNVRRYGEQVRRRFPYAGVQFEAARADSARTDFTDAYLCATCRKVAQAWCANQPHFMITLGPRAWELRPPPVSR